MNLAQVKKRACDELTHTAEIISISTGEPIVSRPEAEAKPTKLFDATVVTPFEFESEDLNHPVIVTWGKNSKSNDWKPLKVTVADVIKKLCKHEIGPKDGMAWVFADMVPGARTKNGVKSIYAVGLDIDTGLGGAEIDKALAGLGYMAIRYTTHSHMKGATRVKKDLITTWALKNRPELDDFEDPALVQEFLRLSRHYDPKVAETAKITSFEHVENGIEAVIEHATMAKHRVICILAEPFEIAKEGRTQSEAHQKWRKIPQALARALGNLPIDSTGSDPNRLFYLPRHAKGAPFEISLFGGPLLDWKALTLASKEDAFAEAWGKDEDGGKSQSKSVTEAGRKLGRWSAKTAGGFGIVDLLRDRCPEKIRHHGGAKVEIECPFDDDHSNAGDTDDRACFAVNGGEGTSEVFTISCRHDGCRNKTNLDMLGKMIADQWFEEEVIHEEHYNAILTNDPTTPEQLQRQETAQRLVKEDAARGEYQESTAALSKGASGAEVKGAIAKVLEAGLDKVDEDRALSEIKKAIGCTAPQLKSYVRAVQTKMDDDADAAEADEALRALPAGVRDRLLTIEVEWPLPSAAHGRWKYMMFEGDPWACEYVPRSPEAPARWERCWTPWRIAASLEYGDGAEGRRLEALNGGGEVRRVDVHASATIHQGGTGALGAAVDIGVAVTDYGERRLKSLLKQARGRDPIGILDQGGWYGEGEAKFYVTPWGTTIGRTNRRFEVRAGCKPGGPEYTGTLEGWVAANTVAVNTGELQFEVAALCTFAGVLLNLCRQRSMWLAWVGLSSKGKSTSGRLTASASGSADYKEGLFGPMNGTAKSREALYQRGSGAAYVHDEAHLMDGAEFQRQVMIAAGNSGDDALTRTRELREARHWSGFHVATGEIDLTRKIKEAGSNVITGLGGRLLECNVEGTPTFPTETMAAIEAAYENTGHALKRFVEQVQADDLHLDPAALWGRVAAKAKELAGDDSRERRAAEIAAVLYVAGEIAIDAGLYPDSFNIDGVIDRLWALAMQSAVAPRSTGSNIVRSLHQSLIRRRPEIIDSVAEGYRPAPAWRLEMNLAGKWEGKEKKEVVYVIETDRLPELTEAGYSPAMVIDELRKAGLLVRYPRKDGEVRYKWPFIRGLGQINAVVILAEDVEDDPEDVAERREKAAKKKG